MRLLHGLLERLRVLFRRNRFESDLEEELRFHHDALTRRNIERGMSSEEARLEARRSLGRDDATKAAVRQQTRVLAMLNWLEAWRLDIKLAFRMLVKHPGLTLAGGLAMAVGIAIGLAFTSGLDALLYRPPLLRDVVTVRVWNVTRGVREGYGAPLRNFARWRDELQSVQDLSAFIQFEQQDLVTGDGRGDPVNAVQITPSAFRIFRTPPLLGRLLVEEDALPEAPPVALLSHTVWRTRFGSDPDVVGREVRLAGTVHTIVGVMPEEFSYPVNDRLWTPLRTDPLSFEGDGPWVEVFGRLTPGATLERARAELSAVGLLESASGVNTDEVLVPSFVDYATRHINVEGSPPNLMRLVQLFCALLLLVPCANVAILFYARTARRQGEIAVRSALGASRRRIIMQLFVEALVLASVAGVVAFLLARISLGQLDAFLASRGDAEFPAWVTLGVSPSAVWYLLGLIVLAAAVVGVVPAIQATGRSVHSGLRTEGGSGGMRLGLWTVLIVTQVAITVAVLPLAAGVVWNTGKLGMAGHGLVTDDVLTARLVMGDDPPQSPEATEDYRQQYVARLQTLSDELKRRLEAEPDVVSVTYAGDPPGEIPRSWQRFEAEGGSPPPDAATASSWRFSDFVDVNFFDFFDLRLLAGRPLGPGDKDPESAAVIVDRTFVRDVLGEGNAVGRRIRAIRPEELEPAPWLEIVGVVEDFPLHEIALVAEVRGTVYSAARGRSRGIAVRVRSGPAAFSNRLREITASVDPNLGLADVKTLNEAYQSRLDRVMGRMIAWSIAVATLSLLFLSIAGIYALTSFAVTQRRREIGIRVALGAYRHRILGSIFSRAAMQLGLGVALGIALSVPIVSYWRKTDINGMVLGVPDTPGLLIAVVALITVVGLAGAVGPATRGLKVEPTEALRAE
jgi:putative ABC transport system permease protein